MNGAVNGIPRDGKTRPRNAYNPRMNTLRVPNRFPQNLNRPPFGPTQSVIKMSPGIAVRNFIFRRLLGPVGAFFVPTTMSDGTLPDLWQNNNPDGFHLEPEMFFQANPGGATIHLPRGFESVARDLNQGRFNLIDTPPAYYSPVADHVLPMDTVLAPSRHLGRVIRRIDKERMRIVERSSQANILNTYQSVLNTPLPTYQHVSPDYSGINYAGGPNPNNYWVYEWTWVVNPYTGVGGFEMTRYFDQEAYNRDLINYQNQIALQEAIAEDYARQQEEAQYQATVTRVKLSNSAFEFVTSKEKPVKAGNSGRYKRQKGDRKNARNAGYLMGLSYINRTVGHNVFDTVTAFLDNLYLAEKYTNGDPRRRKYLEGFRSYWDRENQRWVYRPKNAMAAFRAYQDGILEFDDMGFFQDVALNRQLDRFYGRLAGGIKRNVNQSGFTKRIVGATYGPAL